MLHSVVKVAVSCVGVGGMCIEFATSSRRLPTKIWKLNMLRIYPAELSCVGGVYAPVGCRDPVSNSAANWIEVGHDVTHDAACCTFVNIGVNCVTLSFAFGKIGKMRLNRKQKKRVAAIVMLRLLRKCPRSGKKS